MFNLGKTSFRKTIHNNSNQTELNNPGNVVFLI